MAAVTLDRIDADGGYRRSLLKRALSAMAVDSLSSVRQIRQPIESDHDIASAFDAITYSKGGGVLAMFERYLGAETFRLGIQDYLQQYAWGNATADDFINSISARAPAGQTDVTAQAFRSFLTQPGVPLLQLEPSCDDNRTSLSLRQSRYLPLGSSGERNQLWQLPVCIRYGLADGSSQSQCQMLSSTLESMLLPGGQCPTWIMPNADGAGYYRFNLPAAEWQNLLAGDVALNTREKLVLADSFKAALQAGEVNLQTLLAQLPQFILDEQAEVAASLLDSVTEFYQQYADGAQQAVLRAQLLPLYQQRLQQLGLQRLSDRNQASLQSELVEQLVLVLDDKKLGNELARMGLAYTGTAKLEPAPLAETNLDLITTGIAAAARDRGDSYLRHLQQQVVSSADAIYRQRLLAAIGRHNDPAQQPLLLQMVLDEQIRDNEIYYLLGPQFAQKETRAQAWQWLQQNLDAVLERIPLWRKGRVSQLGSSFCSSEHAAEVEAFFADRIENLQGGPRTLANTLESIRLCAARKTHFQPQLQALVTPAP
jgi:alanyl aminopeptidase